MPQSRRSSYHHGDLAPVLMDLAVREIEEKGSEKLSLRSLARRAGVSQAAPYHHFSTKADLLAAVATRGFEELAQRLQEAVAGSSELEGQLLEMGTAYVEFAVQNPVVFDLMFGRTTEDFSQQHEMVRAANECLEVLLELVARIVAERGRQEDQKTLAGVFWSAAHGVAALQTRMGPTAQAERATGVTEAISKDIRAALQILIGNLFG
ncbi:MAG: TetR/AcrR family transcriptional regulator [Acidobacteriota bacterium]